MALKRARDPYFYCCHCNDGPYTLANNPSCSQCSHHRCTLCPQEDNPRRKSNLAADSETGKWTARCRVPVLQPRPTDLSSASTSTARGLNQDQNLRSPYGNPETQCTEPKVGKLACQSRKHETGFACPVFLHDQSCVGYTPTGRHSRACGGPYGQTRPRDVKKHLLDRNRIFHEVLTEEMREKIKKLKTNCKIKSKKERKEEYCREMYRIIFPGEPVPSPYASRDVPLDADCDEDSATVSTISELDEEDAHLYHDHFESENEKLKTCCKRAIKKAIPRIKRGLQEMVRQNKITTQSDTIGSSSSNSFPSQPSQGSSFSTRSIGVFSSQSPTTMIPEYGPFATASGVPMTSPPVSTGDSSSMVWDEPFSSGPEDMDLPALSPFGFSS